jgi:hypothetical protein
MRKYVALPPKTPRTRHYPRARRLELIGPLKSSMIFCLVLRAGCMTCAGAMLSLTVAPSARLATSVDTN